MWPLDTWSTVNGLGRLGLTFVISFVLLLIFITWHWFHSTLRTVCSPNRRVLQTLSTFVTPTSCASFSHENSFIKHAQSFKYYLIQLDLSDLVDSICTGKVELRDPSDLHDLLRTKLRIYGWYFGLFVGINWSFRISRRMVVHHASIFLRPTHPLNARAVHFHSATPYLDLDFVPFHKLEKEINKIRSDLHSGSTTILEFSCLAPGVRFMDRDFILCAIPFLLRTYKDSNDMLKNGRTTTPLLTRFNTFVTLMSSESTTIKSIGNISHCHAHSLLKFEERLSNDRHLRVTCIQEEGIAGWREKKFMLAWEAGLLRAGFLTRWQVVLMK